MRLAIVGSTQLAGKQIACDLICKVIDELKPTSVVSGGALGVDQLGVLIAELVYNLPTTVYFPLTNNWEGYKVRNILVAGNCDYLVRIAHANSKTYGSGWTRDRAREKGVVTREYLCL